MKKFVLVAAIAALSAAAGAQNITTVNGVAVPKARVDQLLDQVKAAGRPITPELQSQAKDEVVMREIFMQAAVKAGVPQSAEYKAQLEMARQGVLINQLFADYAKKHPVTDAEAHAEYDKIKAANGGKEYDARHILVDNEEQAKSLIAQIKNGAKFEDLATKFSKDPGSAEKGGDLGFANPKGYVPEFSAALIQLKKGEMTQEPVKTQYGYHIIRLDDVRDATFPGFDEVKDKLIPHIEQQRIGEFQKQLRDAAKTDYKFSN